ncbi:MAG: DNA-primase RepB domain-containing protein [Rubrimonas sp.]
MQTSIDRLEFIWDIDTYFEALHPGDTIGSVTLMILSPGHNPISRTFKPREAAKWVADWIAQPAYCAVNRFHGPRGRGRLAQLNALYVDLDVYRQRWLADVPRETLPSFILDWMRASGVPAPSFLVDSGRGYYVLWLVNPLPAQAEPRWRAAQSALVRHLASLGADPACTDASRVLRMPGSVNGKVGRVVRVVAGDGQRHDFDMLEDAVYAACGRPSRKVLKERAEKRERLRHGRTGSRCVVFRPRSGSRRFSTISTRSAAPGAAIFRRACATPGCTWSSRR